MNTTTLAEAIVTISGDLSRLDSDLKRALRSIDRFVKDANSRLSLTFGGMGGGGVPGASRGSRRQTQSRQAPAAFSQPRDSRGRFVGAANAAAGASSPGNRRMTDAISRATETGVRRGMESASRRSAMAGQASIRARDARGRFARAADGATGMGAGGVRDARGRLRDTRGRFLSEGMGGGISVAGGGRGGRGGGAGQITTTLINARRDVSSFSTFFNRTLGNLTPKINLSSFNNKLSEGRGMISSFASLMTKAFSGGFAFAGGNALFNQLTNIGSAIASIPGQFIEAAGTMERMKMTLETVMGSARDAAIMQARVVKMAAVTPFSVEGLTTAVTTMKAFGFESENVLKYIRSIGDAAAARGSMAELNPITLQLSQMKAAGKIRMEDMKPLMMRGISITKALKDAFNADHNEVNEMLEEGKLDIDQVMDAIFTGMDKQYGGQMAKLAGTFTGLMSTIKDVTQQVMARVGEPFYRLATLKLTNLVAWTNTTSFERIISATTSFSTELFKAIGHVTDLTAKVLGLNATGLDGFADSITKVLAIAETVVQSSQNMATAFQAGFELISVHATLAAGKLTSIFIDFASKAALAIYEVFKVLFSELPNLAKQAAGGAGGLGQSLTTGILQSPLGRTIGTVTTMATEGVDWNTASELANRAIDNQLDPNSEFMQTWNDTLNQQANEDPTAMGQAIGAAISGVFGNDMQNEQQTENALTIANKQFEQSMAKIFKEAEERRKRNEFKAEMQEWERWELEQAKFSEQEKDAAKKSKDDQKKVENETRNAKFMETVGLNRFFQEQIGVDDETLKVARENVKVSKQSLAVHKKIEKKVGKPVVAVHQA